jgi:beta-glucosidase
MPNGFANEQDEDAKKYYNDLIDGLREKGVEPVVTLYHNGIPERLQNLGKRE